MLRSACIAALNGGLAVLVACFPALVCAQEQESAAVLGARCDLSVFGEKDTAKFLAFDRDLRAAIEHRDTARLALLIDFPLRINDDGGSFFLHDARSLDGEYERLFPEPIRRAILASTHDTIWCNYSGIVYGEDRVWVDVTDKGIFLASVNLPSPKTHAPAKKQGVDLACHTDDLRIVIDRSGDDSRRYRTWKLSGSLSEKPVIEIEKGTGAFEGTGPCSHMEWNFKGPQGSILVMEPGCYGDEDEPPHGAQAEIVTTGANGKEESKWCF